MNRSEKSRRTIVVLIFIVYWLLIFEGALRKWAFPDIGNLLFFIKDPFVLIIYGIALQHKIWPKTSPLISYSNVLIGISFMVITLQFLFYQIEPIILLYGWRNYFFYLPLIFIIYPDRQIHLPLHRLLVQVLLQVLLQAQLLLQQPILPRLPG